MVEVRRSSSLILTTARSQLSRAARRVVTTKLAADMQSPFFGTNSTFCSVVLFRGRQPGQFGTFRTLAV
jgi:hypothetical protein